MSYISIDVPELYPYVLLVTGLLTFECLILGFVAGRKRSTIFGQEFMNQFSDRHQHELGQEISKGGYPDMGNGIYGMELSYKDWF